MFAGTGPQYHFADVFITVPLRRSVFVGIRSRHSSQCNERTLSKLSLVAAASNTLSNSFNRAHRVHGLSTYMTSELSPEACYQRGIVDSLRSWSLRVVRKPASHYLHRRYSRGLHALLFHTAPHIPRSRIVDDLHLTRSAMSRLFECSGPIS